jgi:hypothetical protein
MPQTHVKNFMMNLLAYPPFDEEGQDIPYWRW